MLVIGCGAGVTAGAVSIDPLVKDQTIAEIEPLVPQVVSTHFAEHNFDVVRNPKVHVHLDDARHYLLTTNEKFDAITSDPLDPWVKGAATLYTREFFHEVKEHLNPGGVVTLFVQLYESNEEAVKSEIATFLEAFPNGAVFANTVNGQGYDLVLFGQLDGGKIDVDAVQARLDGSGERARSRSRCARSGSIRPSSCSAPTPAARSDMAGWLKDAQINTDRNLRLQYLAGLGLNLYQSDPIYRSMIGTAGIPRTLRGFAADAAGAARAHRDVARRRTAVLTRVDRSGAGHNLRYGVMACPFSGIRSLPCGSARPARSRRRFGAHRPILGGSWLCEATSPWGSRGRPRPRPSIPHDSAGWSRYASRSTFVTAIIGATNPSRPALAGAYCRVCKWLASVGKVTDA